MNRPMDERFRLLAAVHLFLLRDGAVLLLRRFNTGYEDGTTASSRATSMATRK